MASLQERQAQMMAFLLAGDDQIAEHISSNELVDGNQRLAIYSNGYRLRLKETLAVDHDVLASYMGDEAFDELCNSFVEANPSQNKSLRYFAETLPDFLAEHYAQYPQLAELAAFERRLMFSFDAADAEPLAADFLQQLAPEDWPACRFSWHPSLQIFDCQFNVVPIWQELKQEQAPPAPIEQRSRWAIWRNAERLTQFTSLMGVEIALLQSLANGDNLSHACEQLLDYISEEEIPSFLHSRLQNYISNGMLCLA
ncbi:MAG: DNA-binding domain-containing protein [Cellvibrionaceae bacterium]|nr:DNA-binding domain-containing protein [Cellvibrionaceae bacterium]